MKSSSINPEYARAKVGRAGVYYLLALGDPNEPSFDTVNKEMLDRAAAEYEAASRSTPRKAPILKRKSTMDWETFT
jgi:hypothetical protein